MYLLRSKIFNKLSISVVTFLSLLILSTVFLSPKLASAITFEKTFGGINFDNGYSVQQTIDGGYILFGNTASFGAGYTDTYLVKTDADGNQLWSKTFGGTNYDYGYSVQQTTDSGYILFGFTYSFGAGSEDMYLIKTDADGNELWSKTFGGTNTEYGYSVQQTTDSGYILFGSTNSFGAAIYDFDLYLIKTDTDGNQLWSKTFGGSSFGGSGSDYGRSVQQTTDGGYIMLGETYTLANGSKDMYLIKTDADGNKLWSNTFGGTSSDWGYSVQQTTDSGYILFGATNSFGAGNSDMYMVKTDADGNQLWSNTFGGTSSDWGYSVQQTTDSGYILFGAINPAAKQVYFLTQHKLSSGV